MRRRLNVPWQLNLWYRSWYYISLEIEKATSKKGYYLPRTSKLSVAWAKELYICSSSQSCCFSPNHWFMMGRDMPRADWGFVSTSETVCLETLNANISALKNALFSVLSEFQLRQILMNMLKIWHVCRSKCWLKKCVGGSRTECARSFSTVLSRTCTLIP